RAGGERNVVPGAEILDLHPGLPLAGEAALVARRQELLGILLHLVPDLGRLVAREAGLLEGVLIVIEHGRGGVERHRQELAVGRRVVTVERRQIGVWVNRLAGGGPEVTTE